MAGLNCNLNELSAAIGIAQLQKLPTIIANRRKIGESVKESLKDCKAVSLGWQVPNTECSYWFLRLKLNIEKLKIDKETFCKALEAEGIPVDPSYRHIQCEKPWFENISLVGEIKDPYAREKGGRVYLLKGAKISINDYFRKELQDRKNGQQS